MFSQDKKLHTTLFNRILEGASVYHVWEVRMIPNVVSALWVVTTFSPELDAKVNT